jgi:hypothetical protein
MRGWGLAAALAVLAGGCASLVAPTAVVEPMPPPGPNFHYAYRMPPSAALMPTYRRVQQADLLRELPEVHWLDGLLALPEPITYVARECGAPDAYYLPASGEVVLCYETLQVLYAQGARLAADEGRSGADAVAFAERYVRANLRFIAAHETGHALIDLLDLPVTGRQEDAVDQFATALMQGIAADDESPRQIAENLRMTAHWFLSRAARNGEGPSLAAYADTHSLDLQRYFNLQCLLYGSDPERFAGIVARGDLPESRARYCPAEARRATSAWMRLLLPHLAPKYRMTEAEAEAWLEQRRQQRSATPP